MNTGQHELLVFSDGGRLFQIKMSMAQFWECHCSFFPHSNWGGEGWRRRLQVPPLACEGPGHPRGGGSVRGHWRRAQRPALLLPVHPHGGHWPAQARLHHLPPLPAASAQGGLSNQLVSHVTSLGRGLRIGVAGQGLLNAVSDPQDADPWWQKGRVHSILGWWWTGHRTNPAAEGVWCWMRWYRQHNLQEISLPRGGQRHSEWSWGKALWVLPCPLPHDNKQQDVKSIKIAITWTAIVLVPGGCSEADRRRESPENHPATRGSHIRVHSKERQC